MQRGHLLSNRTGPVSDVEQFDRVQQLGNGAFEPDEAVVSRFAWNRVRSAVARLRWMAATTHDKALCDPYGPIVTRNNG